jgi:CheY-like chemotaxis protein
MPLALVCDINSHILYSVTFMLTAIDWEVFTSTDADNIIERVVKLSPSVILIDTEIPEGGVLTTQILKKHPDSKNIPVVVSSYKANIADLAAEAGTEFYLRKPFDIKKLQNIVLLAYETKQSGDLSEGEMLA